MSVIAVLQQFEAFLAILPQATKKMSTGIYGHRNFLATYLLLHFPLAIYFYFSSQTRNIKIIFGILSILILLALIFSRSRGAHLVMGIQLFGMLIYLIRQKDNARIKDLIVGGVLSAVLYFGLLSILKISAGERWIEDINLLPATAFVSPVVAKQNWAQNPPSLMNIFTGKYNAWHNLSNRWVYWGTGWEIFKDYWLTGTGPWTFELLYPVYLEEASSSCVLCPKIDYESTESFKGEKIEFNSLLHFKSSGHHNPPHSHNIFVQIATETGGIGLGLFMVFLITLYSRGIYLLRNGPPEAQKITFCLILSITGFMIHNQIEYNWIQLQFIYPFIFLVFAMDFLDRKYSSRNSSIKKINPLIHSSFLLAFLLLGTLSTVNYYRYQALIYEKIIPGTEVDNLRKLTNEAKMYCPACGRPGLEMAKNLISQYRLTPNKTILVWAETELKEVALLTPFNFKHFIYLAEIRSFQKNWDGAKKLYDQAFKNTKMKTLHACRVVSSNPDKC
jgi:O-antigen ligase